jgi:hypothetical protein
MAVQRHIVRLSRSEFFRFDPGVILDFSIIRTRKYPTCAAVAETFGARSIGRLCGCKNLEQWSLAFCSNSWPQNRLSDTKCGIGIIILVSEPAKRDKPPLRDTESKSAHFWPLRGCWRSPALDCTVLGPYAESRRQRPTSFRARPLAAFGIFLCKSVLTPRQHPPTGLTCRLVVATGTRTHAYRTSCLPGKLNA